MDHQLADKRMGSLERSNSMMSSKSIDNEEMMVIEINFGKNKKDDIVVHFGDNPVSLAEVTLDYVPISWAAYKSAIVYRSS